jgi:hypothetical protein
MLEIRSCPHRPHIQAGHPIPPHPPTHSTHPPTHHTSPGSEHGLAIVQQLPAALNRCRAASKGLYTCTRGLQGAHKCLYTLPLCCCCQRATVQSSKLRQQLQLCCSYY